MSQYHLRHTSSYGLSDGVADIASVPAKVWKGVQDSVARVVGAKDAGGLAKGVTAGGVITLVAAPFIAPVSAAAGAIALTVGKVATLLGFGGIVENDVTNKLARGSGKIR